MGSYFVDLFGKKKWRLSLLITSPKCSARFIDAGGPLAEGDTIHLLQADDWSPDGKCRAMRFQVLSIDLLKKKYWGPYSCGAGWSPILQTYEVSDLIHIHGFRKVVMGDRDLNNPSYRQTNLTDFVSGLPFEEWQIVWDILNKLRMERIANRIKMPRKDRDQKFDDDLTDFFISRIITRVNAIFNEELYWGTPADDHYYLGFSPRIESLNVTNEEKE